MARKATAGGAGTGGSTGGARGGTGGGRQKAQGSGSGGGQSRAVATSSQTDDRDERENRGNAATDAFLKLLQSPLVADLLAVAATAALAALAEHGFNSRGAGDQPGNNRRAGRAVKEAGKAAAAAIGRRIEIGRASCRERV